MTKKRAAKGKKQLRKHPSFMSLTLSNVDAESVKTPNEFPFPGMRTPSTLVPQPTQVGRQGSSTLLGEQYNFGSTIGDTLSNSYSPRARGAESPSALRSHYDPKKLPLSISQQTSASSARDWKGSPSISSPLSLNAVEPVKATEPLGLHSRNIYTDTEASGSSKLSGNSVKRINGNTRRRPSVLDPPTLHPNANRVFHAVSPPPALINEVLPKPLCPQSQPKITFSRPSWWANVKTQVSPNTIEAQQRHEDMEGNFLSIKLHVKKPKAKPEAGMRNWVDGLEDERTSLDGQQDIEVSGYRMVEPYKSPMSFQKIMTHGFRFPQIPERKICFSDSEPITLLDQTPSFRFDSPPVRSLYSGSSSQAREEISTPGSTPASPGATIVQPTTSRQGSSPEMDLQSVSFLELSSSEDEMESNSDAPCRRHRIRASIERASYNNEVSVGNAQRAQPVRPRSIVNGRIRPSSRSNIPEKVPPVPKIPDKPRLSQRTSAVQWREMKAGSTESMVDSGESSVSGSIDIRRAKIIAKQTIRRSKFMKVTSEEERLLEAMRDKRARIRQDDFDKGFKTAMQLQDIVARPKTTSADERAFRSPDYGAMASTDLILEDAYPSPEVPVNRKGAAGLISSSKTSPSLSLSPSDVLFETPASHNSPMTPPPGQGALSLHGRALTLSPPRGIIEMDIISHERKRIMSSSVVDLERVEHDG